MMLKWTLLCLSLFAVAAGKYYRSTVPQRGPTYIRFLFEFFLFSASEILCWRQVLF